MSFSSEIKKEITLVELDPAQARAQLCAILLDRASLNMNQRGWYLSFQTENAAIAKHVFSLFKVTYAIEPKLSVIRKMNLKKNNIYQIQVHDSATHILEDLTIMRESGLSPVPSYRLIRSEKNARAFLQGIFLASGSINNPKTPNYHLEMSCSSLELAACIEKLMNRFYFPAKRIGRKNLQVVYMKTGDKIADFLRLLGTSNALFEFEDTRIQRDFYNQITRLDNCEVANEMKSIKAGQEQLIWIDTIESEHKTGMLSEKVRRVMEISKKYPEASVNELCERIQAEYGENITKSGMKHRISKIRELANLLIREKEQSILRKQKKEAVEGSAGSE